MELGSIENATRILGKSQGYLGLTIRDTTIKDGVTGKTVNLMTSAWLPSPAELKALNHGASIHVQLLGHAHPPIIVTIGPTPDI